MNVPIFPTVPNFRDIGDLRTQDGRRVRPGRIYRSGSLADLSSDEWQRFGALGVGLFIDLRSPGERALQRIPWPEPTPRTVPLEVLPDVRAGGEALLRNLLDDGDGSWTRELMVGNYTGMPADFAPWVMRFFATLAELQDAAAIIACTAGQDRTGFTVALLLSALGVSEADILDNYMASLPHHDADRVGRYIAKALGEEGLRPPPAPALHALRVNPDYLASAFDALREQWGDVDGYLAANGVTDAMREQLSARLLETD